VTRRRLFFALLIAAASLPVAAETVHVACTIARQGLMGVYVGVTQLDFRDDALDPESINVGTSYHVLGDSPADENSYEPMVNPTFPASGKAELDYSFDFPLSVYGGCDTSSISAQAVYSSAVYYDADSMCWGATICHLTVNVDSGGGSGYVTQGDPTGDYDCQATITLIAFAVENYDFVGWSGDVNSTAVVVTLQMAGQNRSVTASFQFVPPPIDRPPGTRDGCGDDCSPIVINFANGDYQLTGSNAPVLFDIGATGHPVRIGWTAAGADEAFLWLDHNGNGIVDNGAELFGTATLLRNGTTATNGFEALRELDSNGDGVIDAHDIAWSRLMLWRDLNHNGRTDPGEIMPLGNSGVIALSLAYHWTGRLDRWGNMFRYESIVWLKDSQGHMRAKPVYDVFFVAGQ
jgi:uncharacterized repeat protein (TIGR02543 family)